MMQISILNGTYSDNRRAGPLSAQEQGLLSLLAAAGRPRSAEELGDVLWPERELISVRNCVKVSLYRLRMKLGRFDVVTRQPRGYALGPDMDVDLRRFAALLAAAARGHMADPELVTQMEDALGQLARATTNAARGIYEIEAYLARLTEGLALAAFNARISAGEFGYAARAAAALIAFDPCEELGYELSIRAQLASGDELAAQRTYREHARRLHYELDTEPSERLRSLLLTV